ncbi:hypothetical protein [Geodermatophilus aquaeductus]|uniref:hypothetical protein n=1 Tax=Geodermatophilus aquaeductus TaxID=1564161 RepID=UPI00115B06C3|nr:hypothetical protein [Geodermatophilus aquaeductus]
MTGIETALASLGSAFATEAAKAATAGLTAGLGRRPRRSIRRTTYQALIVSCSRARQRIASVLAVQQARLNPFDPVAVVTGFPVVVTVLDRVIADLADVSEAFCAVQALAPNDVARGAEELLTTVGQLLAHPDPGWHRPRQRREARRQAHAAGERYDAALSEFGRLAHADAAPSRKERRAARRRGTPPQT